MTEYRIPFNKPCFAGKELSHIAEAIANEHISGDGEFTRKCQAYLEAEIGCRRAFLTTSCTHALELAALLLNIQPGDEVIVPSFTFVSTANAFVLRGARPVFSDIRPDTLNMDETLLESLITPKTRAIVPVHYAGVACEMDAILATARRHGINVVEDNSHGLFGKYNGQPLGSFGCMAAQSFHETKNIVCGEGGAILINDEQYTARAEILREKGTNRSGFFRGEIEKYTWVDLGSSYLPSDILAAFLWGQMEARQHIQENRRRVWDFYYRNLSDWAQSANVRLPAIPPHCEHPCHMFYLMMPTAADRAAMLNHLETRGVMAVFHYLPLHLSAMGARFGGAPGQCPVTERTSDCLIRLPFYNYLTELDLRHVVESIMSAPRGS